MPAMNHEPRLAARRAFCGIDKRKLPACFSQPIEMVVEPCERHPGVAQVRRPLEFALSRRGEHLRFKLVEQVRIRALQELLGRRKIRRVIAARATGGAWGRASPQLES